MPTLNFTRIFSCARFTIAVVALVIPVSVLAQEKPRVVAVNYALSYFAERLGGAEVEVVFPVPEGTDPAFWRPGVSEISAMQSADLIILNGAGFATWTDKASLPRSRTINTSRSFQDRYIATESVTHSHGSDGAHSHTAIASFTWLDQELAILQAQAIATAMAARGFLDPDEIYKRLTGLTQDLEAMASQAQGLRAEAEGVVLIATHPRYHYLARAYGLDIRSLDWEAGVAPTSEQLADLADLLAESGAQVLLWEATPPPSARDAVTALGVRDVVFSPLATAPASGDYEESFSKAVGDLSSALASARGG